MALIDNEEKKRLATLNQDVDQDRITLPNLPTPREAGAVFRDVNNKLFDTLTVVPRTLWNISTDKVIPTVKDFGEGFITNQTKNPLDTGVVSGPQDRPTPMLSNIQSPVNTQQSLIHEKPDMMRDEKLGKMTSASTNNPDGSVTNTFSIGNNNLSIKDPRSGGTDRRAVDRNGLLIQSGGSNYSIQGNSDAVNAFNSAVSSGEYSPEAKQARNLQREQFLTRQGFEKVDPATGLTPSKLKSLSPEKQVAIKQAVTDMNLKGVNAEGVRSENKLRDIQGQAAQIKIDEANREKLLQDEYNDPKVTPERRTQIERLLGLKDQTEFGTLDQFDALGNKTGQVLFNKRTGEQKQQSLIKPQPATTEKLLKMRAAKDPNFAAAEAEYKSRFGSLPY